MTRQQSARELAQIGAGRMVAPVDDSCPAY